MASRPFAHSTITVDGVPNVVSTIECRRCGVAARFKHVGRRKPSEAIEQYFRNHGWKVANSAGADVCPDCQKRVPSERAESASAVAPIAEVETRPSLPRQMSRDDRRIIFAKLDEVYLDNRTGYSGSWTDEKIAVDLGIPRAWVSSVRDEFFGASGSNPEIDAVASEIAVVRDGIALLSAEAAAVQKGIEALGVKASDCEARLAKLVGGR